MRDAPVTGDWRLTMRTRTHGHLSEWAALVGAELPEEFTGETVGSGDLDDLES